MIGRCTGNGLGSNGARKLGSHRTVHGEWRVRIGRATGTRPGSDSDWPGAAGVGAASRRPPNLCDNILLTMLR
jgi:hypothetical protein